MTGSLTVEDGGDPVEIDLTDASHWHFLVLRGGRPTARVDIASPGPSLSPALLSAAVFRWGDWEAARDLLAERLQRRLALDAPPQTLSSATCSVVVCTHRRPQDLKRLLGSLKLLDPAPLEVVVVDNDPGDLDCRAQVLDAGFRYLREDRRGLDNARNAGLRAAHGDIVVFTDDDCVASPGWLARMPEEFRDPSVGAVTGPAFPHVLDSPARRRMERQASLARGLRRVAYDWTVFPIAGSGAVGVGANMALRRTSLEALGDEPFPPELDAGTVTESGGDTYVLARILAEGHRIVYDPSAFVYHRHREDAQALHRAFRGYGIGVGSALTKLLIQDRELSTPKAWMWLFSQYRKTQMRRLAGQADRVETRLAWDFLRGGILGPRRWRQALGEVKRAPLEEAPAPASRRDRATTEASRAAGEKQLISIVVPTSGRLEALSRCFAGLAEQDVGAGAFEIIVVDDSAQGAAIVAPPNLESPLRVLRTGGSGAAAARNAGAAVAASPLLLFLDDDIVPSPGLVRRHLERHERNSYGDLIVVGAYPPQPVTHSFASSAVALWWNDLFEAMRQTTVPTYAAALTGNMSIPAASFARSGGFDRRLGSRREDWEWGLRSLKMGIGLTYEPEATGPHEYSLTTAGRLNAAHLEGFADALLLGKHPEAASALIPLVSESGGSSRSGLKRVAGSTRWGQALTRSVLAGLEWANLRQSWLRVFNGAQRINYAAGVDQAGPPPKAATAEPMIDLDLDGTDQISKPSLRAPTLRVRVGGVEVARVRPALGQWGAGLADQILTETPWQSVEQAAVATSCLPERNEKHQHTPRTVVVFGAGHTDADASCEDRLKAAGARVLRLEGNPDEHWQGLIDAAHREDGSELIAFTLPGIRPDVRFLEEALVAFDGSRVGVAVGQGLEDDAPPSALTLHSSSARAADIRMGASMAPHYLVLRRELVPALVQHSSRYGPLAPVIGVVENALENNWIVGYRDVHGLQGAGPDSFDGARASTAVRIERARGRGSAIGSELRRTTALAAWSLIRREGRRDAANSLAGTLSGLVSALPAMLGHQDP